MASRRSTPQYGPRAHSVSYSIRVMVFLYGPSETMHMCSHRMAQLLHPMIFVTYFSLRFSPLIFSAPSKDALL